MKPPMPWSITLPAASFFTWWQVTHVMSPPFFATGSKPMCTSSLRFRYLAGSAAGSVTFAKPMRDEMSPCLTLSSPPARAWQNTQVERGGTPAFMPTLCATFSSASAVMSGPPTIGCVAVGACTFL